MRRYSSSQVTSDSVSRSETCRSVLFQIEIPCILLFLNGLLYFAKRNETKRNELRNLYFANSEICTLRIENLYFVN